MNLQTVSVLVLSIVGSLIWAVWIGNVTLALVRRRALPYLIRRVGQIRIEGSSKPIQPWQAWVQLAFALIFPLALVLGLRDTGWSAEQHVLMALGLISMIAWASIVIAAVLRAPTVGNGASRNDPREVDPIDR